MTNSCELIYFNLVAVFVYPKQVYWCTAESKWELIDVLYLSIPGAYKVYTSIPGAYKVYLSIPGAYKVYLSIPGAYKVYLSIPGLQGIP